MKTHTYFLKHFETIVLAIILDGFCLHSLTVGKGLLGACKLTRHGGPPAEVLNQSPRCLFINFSPK